MTNLYSQDIIALMSFTLEQLVWDVIWRYLIFIAFGICVTLLIICMQKVCHNYIFCVVRTGCRCLIGALSYESYYYECLWYNQNLFWHQISNTKKEQNESSWLQSQCGTETKATTVKTNMAASGENLFAYENSWALTALEWKLEHDSACTCAFLDSLVYARK